MLNGIILLKRPYISPIIATRGSKCGKQLKGSKGLRFLSNCWLLPLTPSSMSSGVILLQRPYISFSSPLLLILRQEITAAAVALLCLFFQRIKPLWLGLGLDFLKQENQGVQFIRISNSDVKNSNSYLRAIFHWNNRIGLSDNRTSIIILDFMMSGFEILMDWTFWYDIHIYI